VTGAVDITPAQKKTILALLQRHIPGVAVWAYGSRVKWTARPNSDLDLVAFATPAQRPHIPELKEALAESDLPFIVDLHVWDDVPARFREVIKKEYVVLQESKEKRGKNESVGDWRKSTWGDEISLEYGKSLRGYDTLKGKFQVFGSNGPIGWTSQPLAPGPGVVLGRKGAYRGVRYSREPFFVIDTAYYVVPKTDLDMRWVYYAIKHHELGMIDDGSPIPSTTRSAVYVKDLEVPPRTEQKATAHVLGTLDDKIELNRRMNETLEAMARALFKSWFVDFDPVRAKSQGRDPGLPKDIASLFPDSFQESSLGPIPEDWEVKAIEELSERIAMGPFGSDIKISTFVPTGVPVVSGQHLRGTLLEDSEFNFITNEHASRLKRSNVQRGDVVFTHAGNIGQVAYIPETSRYERYILSQRQFYIRCNRFVMSPFYITSYFKTPEGQHRLLANTSSTGVPSISQPVTYLRQLKMVIPPLALLKVFDATVGPIHLKMTRNTQQSRTLAGLRDTLLPKLLSGELSVVALMERGAGNRVSV
jgi:type I restriction enzyme S subunit